LEGKRAGFTPGAEPPVKPGRCLSRIFFHLDGSFRHVESVKFSDLLRPGEAGLYCPPGDFYIDPVVPVENAVITHGHGDHARHGHGAVLATAETLAIMAARYGDGFTGRAQIASYGARVPRGDVSVTLHPAGHILGSAQCAISWKGMTIVVSGDYKRRRDPTCRSFEPVTCDVFVSEATFGLPIFHFPTDAAEIEKLLKSLGQFPERTHLVGAYALGKAQRLIGLLREAGYGETIYVHGALTALNALYEGFGVALGRLAHATTESTGKLEGRIVIAPPSAIAEKWARRFADPLPAFASGWMRVRARARQRQVELPLILSDHGDWNELTGTIGELKPQELWLTHGNEDALLRWAALNGIEARALSLVGYEDEEV
jgi:putative mRNA 3-end processing factor